MKKTNKNLTCLLVAIMLCLVSVMGFMGYKDEDNRVSAQEEKLTVGMCFPDTEFYHKLEYYINQYFSGYNLLVEYVSTDNASRTIDHFIADEKVDILIVASIWGDSITENLEYAVREEVEVYVIGDYNENYPKGITYYTCDYYELGVNHVQWIYSNPLIQSYIEIYVVLNENTFSGKEYMRGIEDEMLQHRDRANITYVCTNKYNAVDYFESLIKTSPLCIDEIVTYKSEWAYDILQLFYRHGYVDSSYGIGIRPLPSPLWEVEVEELAQKLFEEIYYGGTANDYEGSHIVYMSYSGYVQYVHR